MSKIPIFRLFISNIPIISILCPTFCIYFEEIQQGKYLPGCILLKYLQNVGRNISILHGYP